ncbi:uncharacterized protein LOC127277823 [Leptopilina boulardi]|uniref:uncharacterized protein LOC127277823 n=1 Tax=Leptopilina boulardi TaxID=63433 RepID=UPI0021F65C9D|nr:uncharacterized protein LOC127277823 [Leptopilina boulardi]
MVYTGQMYAEMILLYGANNFVGARAAREFSERHADWPVPTPKVVLDAVRRFQSTGNAMSDHHEAGRPRIVVNPRNRERILELAAANPELGIRRMAAQLNLSYYAVQRTLKMERWHAYHPTRVQNLHPGDTAHRLRFCRWIVAENRRDPNFLFRILFTDESRFGNDGIWNFKNFHYWAPINPHMTSVRGFQHRFTINVWAGLIGDRLIGPFNFRGILTGARYNRHMLQQVTRRLRNAGFTDEEIRHIWYQHDNAPTHTHRMNQAWLQRRFRNRFIGRGSRVPWPPRSPDLNPLDYFFWGKIKSEIYRHPVQNMEELMEWIRVAVQAVRDDPAMIRRAIYDLVHRAELCIQQGGHQFEQLLR